MPMLRDLLALDFMADMYPRHCEDETFDLNSSQLAILPSTLNSQGT